MKTHPTAIVVRQLGLRAYQQTLDAMHDFTDKRDSSTMDEIWLLEHLPVFTQGNTGKAEHLLNTGDIEVVQADRGGQVTYHAPGQLILYLLLDLRRLNISVRKLVDIMEQSVIALLANYDISAMAKADAPGVYVDGAKIASLGLRVRKGCTFHGLALNIDMDLSPFSRINPCGYAGLAMTQTSALSGPESVVDAGKALTQLIANELGYSTIQYQESGFE